MICTFGDLTDVTWWRELGLPVRAVMQPNGTLRPVTWGAPGWESRDAARAQPHYDALANLSAAKARDEDRRAAARVRRPAGRAAARSPITVKFFEKGDRPLEIVTSRQWFIKTMDFRDALLARGRELQWHPGYMRRALRELGQRPQRRLVRQPPAVLWRAVPALVPRRRGRRGRLRRSAVCRRDAQLPIDPSTDVPHGLSADQRGAAGRIRR